MILLYIKVIEVKLESLLFGLWSLLDYDFKLNTKHHYIIIYIYCIWTTVSLGFGNQIIELEKSENPELIAVLF